VTSAQLIPNLDRAQTLWRQENDDAIGSIDHLTDTSMNFVTWFDEIFVH
jgi:hypothetical protein